MQLCFLYVGVSDVNMNDVDMNNKTALRQNLDFGGYVSLTPRQISQRHH